MRKRGEILRPLSAMMFLSMLLLWNSCDSPFKKSKDKSETQDPPAPATAAPADWDGKSDWQQNALKIKDIAP